MKNTELYLCIMQWLGIICNNVYIKYEYSGQNKKKTSEITPKLHKCVIFLNDINKWIDENSPVYMMYLDF